MCEKCNDVFFLNSPAQLSPPLPSRWDPQHRGRVAQTSQERSLTSQAWTEVALVGLVRVVGSREEVVLSPVILKVTLQEGWKAREVQDEAVLGRFAS